MAQALLPCGAKVEGMKVAESIGGGTLLQDCHGSAPVRAHLVPKAHFARRFIQVWYCCVIL